VPGRENLIDLFGGGLTQPYAISVAETFQAAFVARRVRRMAMIVDVPEPWRVASMPCFPSRPTFPAQKYAVIPAVGGETFTTRRR
jgi:hypothetical protein